MDTNKHPRLLTLNDPHAMRINAALASEIGLNESIVLLQIEFLISISKHERDGRMWTYQSTRDLQENYFSWWSTATINRAIANLEERGLIIIGNYNGHKYDRTRWFALNAEGINALKSVRLIDAEPIEPICDDEADMPTHDEQCSTQNETPSTQNETRSTQDEPTIPEITSETTSTTSRRDANASPPRRARAASPEERQHRAVRAAVREFFEAESGLTIPSAGKTRHLGALWWAPIREICELNDYDLGAAKDTVKTALDRLRGKTVSDPNSILKTARAVVGERKRGVTGKTEAKATTAWKRY